MFCTNDKFIEKRSRYKDLVTMRFNDQENCPMPMPSVQSVPLILLVSFSPRPDCDTKTISFLMTENYQIFLLPHKCMRLSKLIELYTEKGEFYCMKSVSKIK